MSKSIFVKMKFGRKDRVTTNTWVCKLEKPLWTRQVTDMAIAELILELLQ